MAYTIGVRVVYSHNNSNLGHMYIVFKDANGVATTYGFYPKTTKDGFLGGPGEVRTGYDMTFHESVIPGGWGAPNASYDFDVSQADYQAAKSYADAAAAGVPPWNKYNPYSNTCVDFAWNVLNQAHLGPPGHEGVKLPSNNDPLVQEYWYKYFRRPEFNRESRRSIRPATNTAWNDAVRQRRRDPLAIDLDGDGIETVGVPANGSPVLFDHDADGVRTGTGWVAPDDAFLVLDRNGNGAIDSGRELFGVDTVITTNDTVTNPDGTTSVRQVTRTATSGFEALRSLDTGSGVAGSAGYGDGVFDARDAQFANVRLWQDRNQDGISQADEMVTLASKGIVGISLTASTTSLNLGNGNTVTGQATVTRSNGTTTRIDSVDLQASNLNLAANPFYRQFQDPVPLTDAAAGLPDMQGSGQVRDLREAMSLRPELAAAVAAFAAASTRDAQRALLPEVLKQWAASSTWKGSADNWSAVALAGGALTGSAVVSVTTPSAATQSFFQSFGLGSTDAGFAYVLQLLEHFNGTRWFETQADGSAHVAGGPVFSASTPSGDPSKRQVNVAMTDQSTSFLQNAYASLLDSVYDALVWQTRLEPYLDAVQLIIDESGSHFDPAPLAAMLDARHTADPRNAAIDLVELTRYSGSMLTRAGFDSVGLLRTWMAELPAGSALRLELSGLDVLSGASTAGSSRPDLYVGDAAANAFAGGSGDDWIDGGAGNDVLNGQDGMDTLDGGLGNDTLIGGLGDNTYLFGRGDGVDYLQGYDRYSSDATATRNGVLQLKSGVMPTDVVLKQVSDGWFGGLAGLEVSISGTSDKITVSGFFVNDDPASAYNPIQQLRFADGTIWDLAAIKAKLFAGTDGNDNLIGTVAGDAMSGGLGNDALAGRGGDDSLSGAAGNDLLNGEAGNDVLDGEAGNDTLIGGLGNNTYRFGRGDGVDYLQGYDRYTSDASATKLGTLEFKTGVGQADVVLKQVGDGWFGGAAGLEVSIAGTTDKVTISGFFVNDDPTSGYNPVQQFRFADGTVWDLATIKARLFAGTDGNDAIVGTTAADSISGGLGADNLAGRGGDDALDGGDGNDLLNGQDGNDTLIGSSGNDTLIGGLGNNSYVFGRGDGVDYLQGYDRYTSDATATKLGTLQFKPGISASDIALKQVIDGWFGGAAGLEVSIAGSADKITISGFSVNDDPSSAYNPVQQFRFADGTVWNLAAIKAKLFGGTAGDDALVGTTAADAIDGSAGNDNIAGRAGNDSISGGVGNDLLNGQDGNDILDGGAGNDTLIGGYGNNTYRFGKGDGIDYLQGYDRYTSDATVGRLGTLEFKSGVAPGEIVLKEVGDGWFGGAAGLEVSIAGTTDKVTISGFFVNDDPTSGYNPVQQFRFADGTVWDLNAIKAKLFAGTAGDDGITGTTAADVISGGTGNDGLVGRAGDDLLNGGAGNDVLYGQDGNDTMDGGVGNDTLIGGYGNNTYLFGKGDGADYLQGYDRYTSDPSASRLGTLQFKAGVSPSEIILKEVVDGWFGGAAGLEVSIAGTTDKITISGVFVNDDPTSGYNPVQRFRFADGTVWDLNAIKAKLFAGTAGDDGITGTTAADVISGGAGNDGLVGRAGDDLLNGGAGNDVLYGQDGNDTMDGGVGNDTLIGGFGNNAYLFGRGDGVDYLQGYDRYTSDGSATRLGTLGFKAGIAVSDIVLRQVADGWFSGAAGLEVSIAGTTDKVTISGFFVNDDPYSAYNPVQQFRFADGTVWDIGTIRGMMAGNAVTGTAATDVIAGTAAADRMSGLAGNDALAAGAGHDWLDGGAGNDTMSGGTGNDVYVVDSVTDVVTELVGEGVDTVRSSVTTTLAANVENLVLTGASALNGTGNALANRLFGNAAANVLDGGAGADLLVGGAGNDVYVVDDAGDAVVESAGEGTDTVKAAVTWALGNDVENLTLTGTSAINGTGNALANALVGNGMANVLNGGAGNDRLDGGLGADTLIGGLGNDTYVFGRGDGAELVQENDATSGNTDVMSFLSGVTFDQIWFQHVGNDLKVSIIGTNDSATVQNWYLGSQYHVEQFKTSDGKTLLDSKVQDLVSAMASFTPPAVGQTTLPPTYQTVLQPVMASDWQ